MIILGIDPGRTSGVALVEQRHGQRPLLLACWHVTGDTWRRWIDRARTVTYALESVLPASHLLAQTDGAAPDPAVVRCVIEEPPPVATRWREQAGRPQLGTRLGGRLAGDQEGLRTWAGIGRRQGAWMVVLMEAGWPEPELVDQPTWVQAFGLPRGKQQDGRGGGACPHGQHRIREAALYVEGATEQLAAIPGSYRVDVAEAVLQAAAMTLPTAAEWDL